MSNIDTVKRFLSLLEQGKIEEYVSLYADDGKQVNPYHSGLFPAEVTGKANLLEFWTGAKNNFEGMTFPISEIHSANDGKLVITKFRGEITLKGGAGVYANDYLCLFYFNDEGLITEYHEYFNPVTAAKGFGMTEKLLTNEQ